MLTILVEGIPVLGKSQSIAEAELVERLLEDAAAEGPDMTQVRIYGLVARAAPTTVWCVLVMN